MGLRFLEHFLILTDDPEGTRDWWVDTLGFVEGTHPEFGFPVHWLYIGDQDVVHIGQRNYSEHQNEYLRAPGREGDSGIRDTGSVDHVCFNCDGIEEFSKRLTDRGVEFSERQAHNQSLYQLFFMEPINNIKVELNFSAEEARRTGRLASRSAADGLTKPA